MNVLAKAKVNGRLHQHFAGHKVSDDETPYPFADFLKCVIRNDTRRLSDEYGSEYVSAVTKSAMGENAGTVGGYLLPPKFSLDLFNVISEETIIPSRATVWDMVDGVQATFPKVDAETTPAVAGTSPFFGGMKFSWGSSQAPTETEPKFRADSLKAWDLIGYCTVSNQFLNDIGPQGEYNLKNIFAKAAGWQLDFAFFQGTGTGQPLGIINSPAFLKVTRSGHNQITNADIAGMSAALLPYSWRQAIWVASPTTLKQIMVISNFYINVDTIFNNTDGCIGALMGRPLFISEKLPALGSIGDILLIDPSQYAVAMRQEVAIEASDMGPGFPTQQTDFRVWLRGDGKPAVDNIITLQDKSTQVSPFVGLTAP